MEAVFITTIIVALVELGKRLRDKDYMGALTIVGAAVVGGVCGALGIEVQTVEDGILAGLSASGVVTVAQKI